MSQLSYTVDVNLEGNSLLNARLQQLSVAPAKLPEDIGFIYFDTALNTPRLWDGYNWIDMGSIYSHPSFTTGGIPSTALSGAQVISQVTIDNGHVTNVVTRNISLADIGAAAASHTHAFSQVIGLPTNTILANNTGVTGSAKALTIEDFLILIGIAYGTGAILNTGTDTSQRSWTAKQISDYIGTRLGTYLTFVNLSTTTGTSTVEINNSAGSNALLPAATTDKAGVMTAADKVKLDGVAVGANKYIHPTENPGAHPFATAKTSGVEVLSQLVVNNEGHLITIASRNLTKGDLASVMIVAGTNTTATDQTWSAATINEKVQEAINQAQTGALSYKGEYDPSTNTPNIKVVIPSGTIKIGYTYVASFSGTFLGEDVDAGDMIIAKVDDPGSTIGNWQLVNKNIPAIVSAQEAVEGIIFLATQAETDAGTNDSKAVTPKKLKALLKATTGTQSIAFGNGSGLSYVIPHDLNFIDVHVEIVRTVGRQTIIAEVVRTVPDSITVNLNKAPATGSLTAIIKK